MPHLLHLQPFARTFDIAQISSLFFLLQNFSEVRMWYGRLTYEGEFLLVLACVLCLHCMTARSCTYTPQLSQKGWCKNAVDEVNE